MQTDEIGDWRDVLDELPRRIHDWMPRYIAASALQPPRTAKTVRHRGGKTLVTDGPYAESKEVLGGFILIDGITTPASRRPE